MSARAASLPVVLVGLLLLTACTEPEIPLEDGAAETESAPPPAEPPEEDVELRAQLELLRDTVTTARDRLHDAAAATTLGAAVTAAEDALTALVAAEDADASHPPALLPARTTTRGDSTVPDDLLTGTLTLAQDRGGQLGTRTADLLHDPVAGDLGAWQRDAGGMVDLARATAATSTTLSVLERAILDLDGEGTRALAWTFVAVEATDADLARGAAERGAAHLDIIVTAIDDLDAATPGSSP